MILSTPAVVNTLTDPPVRILIIILVAVALTALLRLAVARGVRRLTRLPAANEHAGENARVSVGGPSPRRQQRLHTFRSVVNSTIGVVVGGIALIMVLSELGQDVAPLLASAGVIGVALAFGAQSLVRDIISGLFMLIEDQYGVGDRVELGTGVGILASGTVEEVALRITTVRDDDGRRWYVRNGEILRVANETQGWSRAIVEVLVAAGSDVTAARDVLAAITADLRTDERYAAIVHPDQAESRVEGLSAKGAVLRWSVRTSPGKQGTVASELRRRALDEFAAAGISLGE